jgi:hypothetical protein
MKILLVPSCGLGNQLFQYAAGLFHAKKYGAHIEIVRRREEPVVSFGHPRPFLLSQFRISAPVREFNLQDRLICSVSRKKRPLVVTARFMFRAATVQEPYEDHWTFLPTLPHKKAAHRLYVRGYFQAYQYAQDVEQRLRTEFQLRNPATGKNLDTLEQIRAAENPVSLHVRRGDYALFRGGAMVLAPRYYARAMQALLQRARNPTFFVFSDDMAFARENLPRDKDTVFVDHNDEANPHEDLRLMSACRHHIIANSTLSWWGAWLNPAPEKTVCAPMSWQNDDPDTPYPHILPPGWLRIDPDMPSN